MVQNAVKAFADKERLYYLGYTFGVPGGTAAVGISAAASRIIGPSETSTFCLEHFHLFLYYVPYFSCEDKRFPLFYE